MLENKLNSFRKEQQEQESKLNKNNNKIINYFKSIYDSTVNYVTSSSTKLDNMSEEKKNKQQQDVKIMKTKTDLKKERLEHLQRVLKHQQTATSLNNNSDNDDDDYDDDAIKSENNGFDKLTKINFILKFLLWLVLFIIFIKIEFGVVYFIISLIVGIYINTSKSRKKGILSAYSVFNPNFERLNGTFTSDHVEKSIRNTF